MKRQRNWCSILLWMIYLALLAVLLPHMAWAFSATTLLVLGAEPVRRHGNGARTGEEVHQTRKQDGFRPNSSVRFWSARDWSQILVASHSQFPAQFSQLRMDVLALLLQLDVVGPHRRL